MFHVFRVQASVREGDVTFLVAASEDQVEMVLEDKPLPALKTLAKKVDGALVCEPALRSLALSAGLKSEPLPQEALEKKAAIGVMMSHGPSLSMQTPPDVLLDLIEATVAFAQAEAWDAFDSDEPLRIRTGDGKALDACVMGQGGEAFGLALYLKAGDLARVLLLSHEDAQAAMRYADVLSLTLADDPEDIADTVQELFGDPAVPFLIRLKDGGPRTATPEEVVLMTASLRAVVQLSQGGLAGIGAAESENGLIRVTAQRTPHPLAAQASSRASRIETERNAPCPCGSGKKYKKCHLGQSLLPLTMKNADGTREEGAHDRDRRLIETLVTFGEKRFGRSRMASALAHPFGDHPPAPGLCEALLCHVTLFDGQTLADRYLAEHAASLDSEDRRWLELQRGAMFAPWEVLRIELERGMELVDLVDGHRLFVDEIGATKTLRPRDVILGRIARTGARHLMCGAHLRPLPPKSVRNIVADLRDGRALAPEARARHLLGVWGDAVRRLDEEHARPGRLTNTDGESLVTVEDIFTVRRGQRDEVLSRLMAISGMELRQDGAKEARLSLTRDGNATFPSWKKTVLATLHLTKLRLVLETNSEERADRWRSAMEKAVGDCATHTDRRRTEVPPLLGGQDMQVDIQLTDGPANAEASMRALDRAWPDTALPALNGQRPRDVIGTPEGREAVHWLLKEHENRPLQDDAAFLDAPGTIDLRKQLGLTDTGELLPHHELHLAMGAGRKISENFLQVAEPWNPALEAGLSLGKGAAKRKTLQRDMEDVLRLAQHAWNAAVCADWESEPGQLGEVRRSLSGKGGGGEMLEIFDEMVARKRALFHEDRRMVAEFKLVPSPGGFGVAVAASVSKALEVRLHEAGIRPTHDPSSWPK
ncbi:MAG: SEC-C metal-binding domain-containing protein [Myxococcaceae bacterium]